MDLGLIIQLISGAVGGNVAGSLMKDANLGPVLNSIIGILGGGLGGQLLAMLGVGGAEAAGSYGYYLNYHASSGWWYWWWRFTRYRRHD